MPGHHSAAKGGHAAGGGRRSPLWDDYPLGRQGWAAGGSFSLVDPRRRAPPPPAQHHPPGPRTPHEALAAAGDFSSWDCPSVDEVLWVGKGAVGRVGVWEGGAAQALFGDAPEAGPAGPPTCPCHPSFLSRPTPATDLTVMEVAEHSVLSFARTCTMSRSPTRTTLMRSRRYTSPSPAFPPRCGRPRFGTCSTLSQHGGP